MSVEVRVPAAGESITEVLVADWLKSEGDVVRVDEPLVTLETDKAALDLPAPASGVLARIVKPRGQIARVGELIAVLEDATVETAADRTGAPADAPRPPDTASPPAGAARKPTPGPSVPSTPGAARPVTPGTPAPPAAGAARETSRAAPAAAAPGVARPVTPPPPAAQPGERQPRERATPSPEPGGAQRDASRVMPAARRLVDEHGLDPDRIPATGPGGRLLKEDVLDHLAAPRSAAPPAPSVTPRAGPAREEDVVPMTMLRRRVAERLVQAQQSAALLTTFNEIDMTEVVTLRRTHQEEFQQRYQVKLGFMSFFVKAVIEALKLIPALNAEIRGTDIVYRNYHDLGIAVGGGRGLVVPVLRDAEQLSFAETERAIADFARRAAANQLTLDELQGGTFTISNGGVYGSLLSTPIVNPPQSGILGLHAIQDRPVAREGQVVIRPMMYVALTYDHRIVDGREAVTFLRHVKACIEDPARILLEI